jgi:hypothetical protein
MLPVAILMDKEIDFLTCGHLRLLHVIREMMLPNRRKIVKIRAVHKITVQSDLLNERNASMTSVDELLGVFVYLDTIIVFVGNMNVDCLTP